MSRGRDTIGKGTPNPGKSASINAGTTGNIRQGERKLERDPRYNSPSGQAKYVGPVEEKGAALVAKVMTRQERVQRVDQPKTGVKFNIEDGNRAKKIDMDKAPE